MSHPLTNEARAEIHEAHGGNLEMIPVYGIAYVESSMIPNMQMGEGVPPALANYKFEICPTCGYFSSVACTHGSMEWRHLPACPKNNDFSLPEGLIPQSESSTPGGEDCTGCVLVCPVCKADGT